MTNSAEHRASDPTGRTSRTGPGDQRVRTERPISLTTLQEMLTASGREIIDAGADTAVRMELSHQLRKILELLQGDSPDPAAVRDRWKQVRGLVGPRTAGTGQVAKVTDLLIALHRRSA